jgi:hypothetical protein
MTIIACAYEKWRNRERVHLLFLSKGRLRWRFEDLPSGLSRLKGSAVDGFPRSNVFVKESFHGKSNLYIYNSNHMPNRFAGAS